MNVQSTRRFTGSIPDAWAGKNSFTGLKALNLAGNDLTGTLPSWNRAGAWRSLEHVDLSENNFYGARGSMASHWPNSRVSDWSR